MEWKPGYVTKQASLMQMYYKSCVHSRTIKVHELLCCINGYAMRIEGKKFEFEDTIVWIFVMHSSVEWLQKGCICKLKHVLCEPKSKSFSASKGIVLENHINACVYFCIKRYLVEHITPKKLDAPRRGPIGVYTCHRQIGKYN